MGLIDEKTERSLCRQAMYARGDELLRIEWKERQAALEALTEKNLKQQCDSVYDSEFNRAKRAAQRVFASLPTIDAEPRWIPCSERLPKKDGRYLVTYFWQAEGKIYETDSSLFVIVEDDDDYWDFDNVVAWMPLPEPYREVEE